MMSLICHPLLFLTKEDESVLFYSISIRSFENPLGGPDNNNNFWSDSNSESNLGSEWIDISGYWYFI